MRSIMEKIDLVKLLILAVISTVTIYCIYGLLSEGKITWIPKRAFISFLIGIIQALIVGYLGLKRPNKIIKY